MTAHTEVQKTLLKKEFAILEGLTVNLTREANEEGHLFAGIHGEDIREALALSSGCALKTEYIVLEKPIKMIGSYPITIRVGDDHTVVTLVVTRAE